MRVLLVGMGFLACAVACSTSSGGADPGSASSGGSGSISAGGGAGVGGEADSVERCIDGGMPTGGETTDCPTLMPTGGTCCAKPGMACFYPGDETYRKLARCIDDPQYGPYWQATYALDRLECGLSGNIVKVIELGADALACSERETKPCDPQGLVTPQELLNDQFNKLVQKCGGLPNETSLEVRFTDGCATELRERGIDDDAARLSCIQQALDAVHFACADGLDCAAMEVSTLQ